ncbi:unnamed protein product, partial [marine sediment metagenome]
EAGCYLAPGEGNPMPHRPLTDIIDDELVVTESMIDLLKGGRVDNFLEISSEGSLRGQWPQFVEQLIERASVMRRHRDDEIVPIQEA